MSDKEITLYYKLMSAISNKIYGNADEADIQRILGALYQSWIDNGQKSELT